MTDHLTIIIVAAFAGAATYFFVHHLKLSAALSSALVCLACGLVLPTVIGPAGTTLAVVAAAASYAGMVSRENLATLSEMIIVGILCGLVFIAARPAYEGIGGKLGTIAAISCFSFRGLKHLFVKLTLYLRDRQHSFGSLERIQ